MRTRSRNLIAIALAASWVLVVATLGGLAWWKVSHAESGEDGSRDPLLRADRDERDPLMRAEEDRPERYLLPPADAKLKLPDDLPLPTVPEVEKP